jgi:hypothetical protein
MRCLKTGKSRINGIKKPAFSVPVSVVIYGVYWPRNAPMILFRQQLTTTNKKTVVQGFS